MKTAAKKLLTAIMAALTAALIMTGCADPEGVVGDTTPAADMPESSADTQADIPQSPVGTVTFYSESVDEDEKPVSVHTFELEPEQEKKIAAILASVEWIPDAAVDRLRMRFDGEIKLSGMDQLCFPELETCLVEPIEESIPKDEYNACYFGYDGGLCYKGYLSGMSEEQVQYIRSLKPLITW